MLPRPTLSLVVDGDLARAPARRRGRDAFGRGALLVASFFGYGLAVALMVRSGLGLGPWDGLHAGMHAHLGIGVGAASVATGVLVLVASLPLGVRPGVGTVGNMVLSGVFTDLLVSRLPNAPSAAVGVAWYAAALVLSGWCTGAYMAVRAGSGPRDGFTFALARRRGWRVARVRTAMELSVLVGAWALGAPIGLGTLLCAVLVGPCTAWGMRHWGVEAAPAPAQPVSAPVDETAPRRIAA